MDELDARLHGLVDLSPPATPRLDDTELLARSRGVRRRAIVARTVPVAFLVVALGAGAIAWRTRDAAPVDMATGPTPTTAAPGALTDRDKEVLGFIRVSSDLVSAVGFEMLATAPYSVSPDATGQGTLATARAATDAATGAYRAQLTQVDPGRESQATRDAAKQADNRLKTLTTLRAVVDPRQTDGMKLVDQYVSMMSDIVAVERSIMQTTNAPVLFRGIFAHTAYMALLVDETHAAALLSLSVQVGYFPTVLPGGEIVSPARRDSLGQGCGDDTQAAGDQCPAYRQVVSALNEVGQADKQFEDFATGQQKQIKRNADAGLAYDELQRQAMEAGQGRNDLSAIAPARFIAAAHELLTKRTDASRQILDGILTAPPPSSGSGPPGTTFNGAATAVVPGEAPPTTAPTSASAPGTTAGP